jgi:aminoglycoside 2''-phosphotransferase
LRFGAIGYPRLPGRPLDASRATAHTAGELAGFLRKLHGVPRARLAPLSVPEAPGWHDCVAQLEPLLPRVEQALAPAERDVMRAWWHEALVDAAMTRYEPSLRHGDLWHENVLVDAGAIVAVVDWEGATVGDPAEDLAPQFYLGEAFADAVLDAYGADDVFRNRVRRHRELREFAGLRWALSRRDDAELAESLAKIRSSPIFAR